MGRLIITQYHVYICTESVQGAPCTCSAVCMQHALKEVSYMRMAKAEDVHDGRTVTIGKDCALKTSCSCDEYSRRSLAEDKLGSLTGVASWLAYALPVQVKKPQRIAKNAEAHSAALASELAHIHILTLLRGLGFSASLVCFRPDVPVCADALHAFSCPYDLRVARAAVCLVDENHAVAVAHTFCAIGAGDSIESTSHLLCDMQQ